MHHCLGHPVLLHLRHMSRYGLVSGLPFLLPPLPPSLAPLCTPCIEGWQRVSYATSPPSVARPVSSPSPQSSTSLSRSPRQASVPLRQVLVDSGGAGASGAGPGGAGSGGAHVGGASAGGAGAGGTGNAGAGSGGAGAGGGDTGGAKVGGAGAAVKGMNENG
ncbi:unnamed protein product [Closterium sp. NIES-54]